MSIVWSSRHGGRRDVLLPPPQDKQVRDQTGTQLCRHQPQHLQFQAEA